MHFIGLDFVVKLKKIFCIRYLVDLFGTSIQTQVSNR